MLTIHFKINILCVYLERYLFKKKIFYLRFCMHWFHSRCVRFVGYW